MLGSIKLRYIVGKPKMEPTTRLGVLQRNQEINKIGCTYILSLILKYDVLITLFAVLHRRLIRVSKNKSDQL